MKKSNLLFFKALLLTVIVLCLRNVSSAQNVEISGTVKNEAGAPLFGVSVTQKSSNAHDLTKEDGRFTIKVSPGAKLSFSYIGYQPKEVAASDNMEVVLMPGDTSSAGTDVVVTAFGIKKETKNIGYSVTTVAGDDITRTNTINPITALQGKVAGVQVNVVGASGIQTSPYIQIRGSQVLGSTDGPANNQPIFVIDGNVITNNISGPDATDGGSQLKNLNPDDYESITVLKGAAATAIYGSRGLNGAVVITTKSGKSGKGIGIEYSSTYSVTDVYAPFMKLQNEYGMGYEQREGNFAADGTQEITPASFGPKFDGTLHPAVFNKDTLVPYSAQPNNWKAFYQSGLYANNNVTLSGGSDKFNYRLSYSNTHSTGVLIKNGLNRNAIDLKTGGQINKVFSVDFGVNYANTVTKNYYNQGRYAWTGGGNPGFNVYYLPRNTNIADWHNTYRNADNTVKANGLQAIGTAVVDGFANLDNNNYQVIENSLLTYLQLKAQVNNWLDLSGRGNINYLADFNETKDYGNGLNNSGGEYGVGGNHSASYDLLFTAHATAKAMHNDLSIDARILNEYYGNFLSENWSATTNGGLKVPNQFFLGNSINVLGTSNGYTYGIGYPNTLTIGVAGDLNLNYKGYLNLEILGRNDWLSTLTYPSNIAGKNNYSVFYPAVSASYSFYDHLKSSMPNWLSNGRIRASYAEVGNAGIAGPYSTQQGYKPDNILDQNGNSVPSGTFNNGNIKPNYNLMPQIARSIELGTNLSFFKNLITLDFAYYKTNTYNQLLHVNGVMETGYNKLYLNAGNIQNQGLELLIDLNPIRTKDWNLDFSVNMAHNRSKAIKLYPGMSNWQVSGSYEGAAAYAFQGGSAADLVVQGSQTSFQLDPKTGYPIIKTDGRATSTDPSNKYDYALYQYTYLSGDSLNDLGRIEPNLVGGTNFTLRYKNFSLFAQVDGRFGGMIYSESYTYAMGNGTPLTSLKWRDQAHGGVARTDSYTGKTVYNGAVPDAVFAQGEKSPITGQDIGGMTFKEAYNKKLVESWFSSVYYDGYSHSGTYDWENGINDNGAVAKESWVMLREITLSYQLPSSLMMKTKIIQSARLSFSARNIGYLYNSLPSGQNPESVNSNDPNSPFITGGVPFSRNYAVSLNVRF